MNLFWRFTERTSSQLISFIVLVVLARLLLPSEFGLIAMVIVFISIADAFVKSGFGQALIQKKNINNLDYSSIFYLSISVSLIFYSIIFLSAPYIAEFYGYEILTQILRVLGLRVIFAAINTVQLAYVARNMLFKKYFYSTLAGVIVSAAISIMMAYMEYGVWALIAQQMINYSINTLVLWFFVKWRPSLQFSIERVRQLFSFGWKLLLAGLLNTFSNELRHLIIGKMYSPGDLGFYDRGFRFPSYIMNNINASISSVMFPVVSKEQDNLQQILTLTRKSIHISSYIIFPIMIGLAVIAEPMIKLLLTEKWLPCVPYLRIGCYLHAVTIMQVAIQNALLARGRSDIFLTMDIVSKMLGFILLLCVMRHGVMAIALTAVVTSTFNVLIKMYVSKILLGYLYRKQIKDIFSILIISGIMGYFVYMITFFNFSSLVTLSIQIPFGIMIYVMLSYFSKIEGFNYTIAFLKTLLDNRKS